MAGVGRPAIAQTAPAQDSPKMDAPAEGQSLPGPAVADQAVSAPVSDDAVALIPDPWSGPNHAFYRLSTAIDRAAIAPAIRVYDRVVPTPIRNGLDNAIQNLAEPRTAANDILQGRFKPAGNGDRAVCDQFDFWAGGLD